MGTTVIFPLSPSVLLIGTFEGIPDKIDHSYEQVTKVNTHIANHSVKQIYARDDSFPIHLRDRLFVRGADLSRLVSQRAIR
ncbi:DUF4238 domain-containing protein [Pseudogemmobacter sp. CC-YST710]|uniref:DUF4238 domain-containing protein n=2 Tax=Pseudogemmobacter faecipullorum TaxID=2755041 RepID=A0ABS8CMB6_9RHOB|nr:DUF4238 domain-containing protein [Pseudogemmobacter faecipullorum]